MRTAFPVIRECYYYENGPNYSRLQLSVATKGASCQINGRICSRVSKRRTSTRGAAILRRFNLVPRTSIDCRRYKVVGIRRTSRRQLSLEGVKPVIGLARRVIPGGCGLG